ncbi:hypothetical protein LTR53_006539 [Teratosphaeriaceae sp. CCFEE 6253]|nr:hypothetical protein LTR53_006539 [Teratosphaeriaceae sp. CCFEE 6253]
MATVARPGTSSRAPAASRPRDNRPAKHKKEQRTEIWSNLLRQTREAQARSRTAAVQHRELIVCGGSPDDQRALIQTLARPPPPAPPSRNRDQRPKPTGEVRLSNQYAYGYGHVTLYSAPQQQSAGYGLLGGEVEEVVKLEVHTLPEPEVDYERTLRRLLMPKVEKDQRNQGDGDDFASGDAASGEGRRPAVALLLSWKEPWRFLTLLRRWLQLLARALLPLDARFEDPLEVLKEHKLAVTVCVQHVEAQEGLERESYSEESFDYISQCIRTCILPLSAGLVYTSSTPPPQQPGSPLSDVQKVMYISLGLDLAPLSPSPPKSSTTVRRDDLGPKHNVVDRMALIVPSGWDSAGKIRLLSETFSPESVLEAWIADLNVPISPPTLTIEDSDVVKDAPQLENQANAGAEHEQEVFATSPTVSEAPSLTARPFSPSKRALSAISSYEQAVLDPNAHKAPRPPQIEITTKPTQQFLAEMRAHLQQLEAEDAEKAKHHTSDRDRPSTTAGSRALGMPSGEQTGALDGLGDVSFNVGGVEYNAVTAEAAIERLRRPAQLDSPVAAVSREERAASSPRTLTPRPPRRDVSTETPAPPSTSSKAGKGTEDLPIDKLEEYFHSLMKRSGGGGASGSSTPSRGAGH